MRIRQVLNDLPTSLNETYDIILLEIGQDEHEASLSCTRPRSLSRLAPASPSRRRPYPAVALVNGGTSVQRT